LNNHLRRARAHEQRVERAEQELRRAAWSLDACTPEERLCLRRCAEAVNERLSSVADWQTQVFVMRHVENLPIEEIARRTSRSNDAVRSSLYRVKRLVVEAVDPGVATAN
jgi:DNA-directed RNA polymerase specialized sigma24 family protein